MVINDKPTILWKSRFFCNRPHNLEIYALYDVFCGRDLHEKLCNVSKIYEILGVKCLDEEEREIKLKRNYDGHELTLESDILRLTLQCEELGEFTADLQPIFGRELKEEMGISDIKGNKNLTVYVIENTKTANKKVIAVGYKPPVEEE